MLEKVFSTKNILIFMGVCILVVAGIFYFIFTDINEKFDNQGEQAAQGAEAPPANGGPVGEVSEEEMKEYEKDGLNPFGTATQQENLTQFDYETFIHGMSHQKVVADQKWGFYGINQKRIDWLLEGLEKADVGREATFRSILERWKKGDFSQVDEDHNTIWKMQGGTIGKATGILSSEQEREYLNSKK